jgi:hypothetical protein
MIILSGESEPRQRRSLFHTRYKCEGKLSNMIIDGARNDNMVSEEMFMKLKIKREKHPHPYWIVWVYDDHKVLVSEQCLVKFKIGSYHDKILCNIVPIEVCHLLLGRPWMLITIL